MSGHVPREEAILDQGAYAAEDGPSPALCTIPREDTSPNVEVTDFCRDSRVRRHLFIRAGDAGKIRPEYELSA